MNDLSVSMSMPNGPLPQASLPEAPAKVTVRNLNFYYGEHHALKNINLTLGANRVTAFIGPSGCGKSTLLRIFNRMYDLYPGQRATGQLMLDPDQHPRSQARSQSVARPRRHGVPEADAVSDDDL